MPTGEVVFDTTCPLYFAATGHGDILGEWYAGWCYLPEEVRAEIERGEAELWGPGPSAFVAGV